MQILPERLDYLWFLGKLFELSKDVKNMPWYEGREENNIRARSEAGN